MIVLGNKPQRSAKVWRHGYTSDAAVHPTSKEREHQSVELSQHRHFRDFPTFYAAKASFYVIEAHEFELPWIIRLLRAIPALKCEN